MQREIKFRAWDKTKKQMIPWEKLCDEDKNYSGDDDSEHLVDYLNNKFSNIEPLMQFTGILDTNGKEIYEKDIVKFCYSDDMIVNDEDEEDFPADAQITVVKNFGIVSGDFEDWNEWTLEFAIAADYIFEVIGNIYESKYLLDNLSKLSEGIK